MIYRRRIVLAAVLMFVLLGLAYSQDLEDASKKLAEEKQIGIIKEPPREPESTSKSDLAEFIPEDLEKQPEEVRNEGGNSRYNQEITFDRYNLHSYSRGRLESTPGYINYIDLYRGDVRVGIIYFIKDEVFNQASTAVNVGKSNFGDFVLLYYASSRLDEVLGILRNEKNLAISVISNNSVGIITTTPQPIGGS